jgi:uncharacterized protein YndB with AHSA1/START domain
MAVVDIDIEAAPEQVFEVLSVPASYEDWVVGSSEIRDAEGGWPSEGATFHHTQGIPRVGLKDTTSVLESDPPNYLCLCVRARPVVIAKVELRLTPAGAGTHVEMTEAPVGGWLAPIHNPLFDLGLKIRNAESLRRLKRLAERTAVDGQVPVTAGV